MEHIVQIRALGAAAVIAIGAAVSLITSTVVVSRALKNRGEQSVRAQQELTVKGLARTRVRSDLGVWGINISGDGADLQQAYAVLEFGADRVQAFLAEQKFTEDELALSAIDTTTHFLRDKDGRESQQVVGFSLRRTFTVTSGNVDRIAQAAGEVTRLLQENIRVTSSAPEYTYTKVADLKVEILGEASRDARHRADQIASNAGGRTGPVHRAAMGVIQITRPNSTDVSSYGLYDTSTIEKDVSVVVTMSFAIESL